MSKLFLSEIYIYPVKSLGGISLSISEVEIRGLKYDRRWMLIDETGKFITQRTNPQLALINVEIKNNRLKFLYKKSDTSFSLDIDNYSAEKTEVIIWNDEVPANIVSIAANNWFSEILGLNCRLVYMSDDTMREVDKKYARDNEIVSFADAYPLLLIGQSSLDELNSRLEIKLPMNRFRPNLVFCGGEPFDEDRIKCFTIGEITFYPVKPCSRCVVTTIDQESAVTNLEPLKTLATYRTINNKVMFGQNIIHKGCGTIKVGDELNVLDWK